MLARTTDGINAPTTIKPKIDVDSVNNFKLFSIVVINFVPEVYPALKSGILNIFNATLTAIQIKIPAGLPSKAMLAAIAPKIVHGITTNKLSPKPATGPIKPVLIDVTASSVFPSAFSSIATFIPKM